MVSYEDFMIGLRMAWSEIKYYFGWLIFHTFLPLIQFTICLLFFKDVWRTERGLIFWSGGICGIFLICALFSVLVGGVAWIVWVPYVLLHISWIILLDYLALRKAPIR